MNQEEKYLRSRLGTENHFRVPEDYFDKLASEVMAKLPEQEHQACIEVPLLYRLRPVLYAAAFLLMAVLSVTAYLYNQQPKAEQTMAAASQQQSADAYIDEYTDYVMFDNTDIDSCLASE